ncbi:Transposase [Phytophthora megakarya]|uniref:Transposase n=1 Tax=Phytophthora megakarya TaxID=4795 RepID=A0A225V1M4_9STRA|nr:Transposase [Phytophthora megakarya]
MARGQNLTPRETAMVINAYEFFHLEKEQGRARGARTCKLVHMCLGIAKSTVLSVWSDHMSAQEDEVTEEWRGRPPSFNDDDVAPVIRDYANSCNERRLSITAKMVADEVTTQASFTISRRAMNRLLKRVTYLQRKLQNRDRNNNPIRPEVYLDESYVNVNHVRGMT